MSAPLRGLVFRIEGWGDDAEMWRFKACPRCGGDNFVDRDHDGWYEQCLQCGHGMQLATLVQMTKAEASQEKERGLARREGKARPPRLARR